MIFDFLYIFGVFLVLLVHACNPDICLLSNFDEFNNFVNCDISFFTCTVFRNMYPTRLIIMCSLLSLTQRFFLQATSSNTGGPGSKL